MTPQHQLSTRIRTILSEEADDYGEDRIDAETRLRELLPHIGQMEAAFMRLEAELGIEFTSSEEYALSSIDATTTDLMEVVKGHITAKETA